MKLISSLFGSFFSGSNILLISLIFVCGAMYLNIQSLQKENEILRLKELHSQSELEGLELKLKEQNEAISKVRLDLKNKNEALVEVSKVQKVFLKDTSCESELFSYKELFNILGTEK